MRLLLTSSLVVFGVSAACGDRTPLPELTVACQGTEVALVKQVPNLYFVLDRSTSMNQGHPEKWTTIRNDIADLMVRIGTEASFGAAWFPPPGGVGVMEECRAGTEVMSLRPGDGQPASMAGSTAHTFLSLTNQPPLGGTPTAATFQYLAQHLPTLPGHTFAILATDGGPNCNFDLACGADACTANIDQIAGSGCVRGGADCCAPPNDWTFDCLDSERTINSVAVLAGLGIPTYVIGVPGSEAYSNVLEKAAKAGRTARATAPHYYPVNTDKQGELIHALDNIAARIAASCELELKSASVPGQTNVLVDGKAVGQSGADGWTANGNFVTLLGKTCDQFHVDGKKVTVTLGCPTKL